MGRIKVTHQKNRPCSDEANAASWRFRAQDLGSGRWGFRGDTEPYSMFLDVSWGLDACPCLDEGGSANWLRLSAQQKVDLWLVKRDDVVYWYLIQ